MIHFAPLAEVEVIDNELAITMNDDAVTRIALGIEYNGSQFNGYQLQTSGTRTVQGELEKALSKVADEPIRLSCAGRTDTGVHATGQVVRKKKGRFNLLQQLYVADLQILHLYGQHRDCKHGHQDEHM